MARLRSLCTLGLLALFAGTPGCDSSAEGGGGGSHELEPRPVSAEQQAACLDYAKKSCAREAECSPYNISNFYGSLENCEKRSARSCVRDFALPGNTQTLEGVQKCAASMPTAVCARAFGMVLGDAACDDPPGTLKNGSACIEDSQCASDRCDLSLETHCYTCTAGPAKTAPLGGACDPVDGPDCQDGVCYINVCTKIPQLGEACDESSVCAGFLPCRNGVCSGALGDGADCTSDADCVFGFACVAGKCSESPPNTAKVGTACGYGIGTLCAIFTQYCAGSEGASGSCQLLREEGEGCGFDVFGEGTCASGLECVDSKCQLEGFSTCL